MRPTPGSRPGGLRGYLLVLLVTGLLFGLGVSSGIIPRADSTKLGLIVFGVVTLVSNLNRLLALSFSHLAVLSLLFMHFLNVCRAMTIFEYEDLFDRGRLPLSLAVSVPIIVVGWRGIITGPGFAALSGPVVYLSWAILSSGFGLDPAHSYFYAGWLLFICLMISLSRGLHEKPESFWRKWLDGLVVVGVFFALCSILVIVFDVPGARYDRRMLSVESGVHILAPGFKGLFTNPNTMSAQAMLTLAAALARCYLDKGKRPKWLEPVLAVATVAALLSGSRAAFLGVVAGGCCYLWLFLGPKMKKRKKEQGPGSQQSWTRTAMAPLALVVLVLAFLVSPTGRVGLDRLVMERELSREGDKVGRDEYWSSFAKGLYENPVFGTGYMSKPMLHDWETLRLMPGQVAKSAHSAVVEYGTTTGVIGLLLFVWLLWGGVRGLLRPGHKEFARSAVVFWIASAPIYLFSANGNGPNGPSVWPLWVLLLCARSVHGQPLEGQAAPPWVLRISRQEEAQFRATVPREERKRSELSASARSDGAHSERQQDSE